jgi:hypothetical protein
MRAVWWCNRIQCVVAGHCLVPVEKEHERLLVFLRMCIVKLLHPSSRSLQRASPPSVRVVRDGGRNERSDSWYSIFSFFELIHKWRHVQIPLHFHRRTLLPSSAQLTQAHAQQPHAPSSPFAHLTRTRTRTLTLSLGFRTSYSLHASFRRYKYTTA